MTEVINGMERLNQHVVDVHFHSDAQLICEHLVYKSLVGCSGVLQTERHDLIAVRSLICDEGCLLAIIRVHHYLIVSREGVHEGQHLVSGRRLD
uniref:Uncharacterized protein n=1 Tax=Brassica oleracea var. oleracea TaxID=109376 RepID=A0A0D3CG99_BRAOL